MNLIDSAVNEFEKYGKYITFATVAAGAIVAVVVLTKFLSKK